ncbi:MAG: YraN family protein [Crocinitomicaceae bacterium]|nr:YraN family protein [Crocinitomicaceae bacterium]
MNSDSISTKEKGDEGEALAAKFLEGRGYRIIDKKWISGKFEIDLIATEGISIVFVEVKLRYSNSYGEPWEAVNKAKRKKIMQSAHHYIEQKNIVLEPRFDIVSIICTGKKMVIEHIPEAFFPVA